MDVASPSPPPTRPRAVPWLKLGFAGVLLLALAPALSLSPFPSQDGPSHVYAARAIDGVLAGERPYATLYDVDLTPGTNWLGGVLFLALGRVVPIDLAERLLIVAFVTVFSLGWWRLARAATGVVASPVVLFGPFFATGMTLHLGFYSYGVGLAMLPWVWALATGRAASLTIAGVLATVAWFGHVLPAAFASLGLVIIGATALVTSGDLPSDGVPPAKRWRRVGLTLLCAAPSGVLCAYWLFSRPTATVANTHLDVATLLEATSTLRPLSAWVGLTEWVAALMALVFAGFVANAHVVARRQEPSCSSPLWPWWALAAATLTAYLVLPEGGQGFWFVSDRLGLYPWLALLPIAASQGVGASRASPWRRRAAWAVTAAICATFGALNGSAASRAATELSASLSEMRGGVKAGKVSILLDFSAPGAARFRPYLHLLGRVAAERGGVDASSHEPHTDHFQLQLRPHHGFPSPDRLLGEPGTLTRHDLRNVCTIVSIGADDAWIARIRGEGWREGPTASDDDPKTRVHHRYDAACSR